MENIGRPGDRTLCAWKGAGFFHFTTFTCDQENACDNNLWQNIGYDNYLHMHWTFFYFGYSRKAKKAHVYTKFVVRENHLDFNNIQHFVPTTLLL